MECRHKVFIVCVKWALALPGILVKLERKGKALTQTGEWSCFNSSDINGSEMQGLDDRRDVVPLLDTQQDEALVKVVRRLRQNLMK